MTEQDQMKAHIAQITVIVMAETYADALVKMGVILNDRDAVLVEWGYSSVYEFGGGFRKLAFPKAITDIELKTLLEAKADKDECGRCQGKEYIECQHDDPEAVFFDLQNYYFPKL